MTGASLRRAPTSPERRSHDNRHTSGMRGWSRLAVVVAVGSVLAGCGTAPIRVRSLSATSTVRQPPSTLTTGDSASGRVIRSASLDDGAFTLRPAPGGVNPQIDQAQAKVLVGSDSQVYGRGWSGVVGFGEVSIGPKLTSGVNKLPAWVAVIQLPWPMCPEMTIPPRPVTAQRGLSYPPGYLAVIVEGTGTRVLDYHSRSQLCGNAAAGPSVRSATQIVSIPWRLVSLHGQIITIRYQDPPCDPEMGIYSVDLGGNTKTEQGHTGVFILAPYGLTYNDLINCGGSWTTQTDNYGTGLGPGAPPALTPKVVTHDPTGPVGPSSSTSARGARS